jgi:hypothetical protein
LALLFFLKKKEWAKVLVANLENWGIDKETSRVENRGGWENYELTIMGVGVGKGFWAIAGTSNPQVAQICSKIFCGTQSVSGEIHSSDFTKVFAKSTYR